MGKLKKWSKLHNRTLRTLIDGFCLGIYPHSKPQSTPVSTGILPPGYSNMSGYGLLKKAREKFPNCPEKSNWMSHISVAKERVCERSRFSYNKQIVFGILERKGNTRTVVADDVSAQTLMKEIQDHTKKGCVYYTDQFRSYNSLSRFGKHLKIDHSSEFKRGNYNPINGIEGF